VKRKNPHPNNLPPTEIDLVLRYAVNGFEAMDALSKKLQNASPVHAYLKAVHEAKHATAEQRETLIELVYTHKLTREQVPTWALANTEVLTALLVNKKKTRITMPLTALLRNIGNMTSRGVYNDSAILEMVCKHLVDPQTIKFSRIHPVAVLTAWFIYRSGSGNKGNNTWSPHSQLLTTLEKMFYMSFKNVEPTGKRICFLIDCSGSMGSDSLCEGVTNAEAAALLAMIFARSETDGKDSPDHSFYLFTSKGAHGGGTGLMDVSDVIDAEASFRNVLSAVQRSDWGTTDISMGILEALRYKRKYDAFVVITDNDVNSGIKPSEAMKQYRDGMKMPQTKLVVVATQGSDYTIADPADPFMMDMCGFDSHGPKILQDFIRGT
jgi:60 kDa SS-A/Ro ribonucleoprotein